MAPLAPLTLMISAEPMGGFGSGLSARRSRRLTTDDIYRVDVRSWQRSGLLNPGRAFTLTFGERRAFAAAEWRRVRISGDIATTVTLVDTSCNFGGVRLWALCSCGRRAAVLYAVGCSLVCRSCANLVYQSQREHERDRALRRARSIRTRLGGDGNHTAPFPVKPRGMRKATYERLRNAAIADEGTAIELMRRLTRRALSDNS